MTVIEIAEMSVSGKLKLMEALRDLLNAPPSANMASPAWYEQALKEAESELTAGTARFVDWGDAKERLRGHRHIANADFRKSTLDF